MVTLSYSVFYIKEKLGKVLEIYIKQSNKVRKVEIKIYASNISF